MLGYPEYADAAWHRTTTFVFTEQCVSKDPTIIPTYARAILFYGCPVVRVNTPGLLQQSHVWYCWWTDAKASSGPERSRTSDHRRSTAQPHIACSPAAALDSSPPKSSVQAGRASVQSAAVLEDDCQLVAASGRRQPRSSDAVTCLLPRTRTCLGDCAFGVAGPRLWNALPISLRQPHLSLLTYLPNFEPMQQQWLEHRHMFRKLRLTMSMNSSRGSRGTTTLDERLIGHFETEITGFISLARVTAWCSIPLFGGKAEIQIWSVFEDFSYSCIIIESEKHFSSAGNITGKDRARLHGDTVKHQCWLRKLRKRSWFYYVTAKDIRLRYLEWPWKAWEERHDSPGRFV